MLVSVQYLRTLIEIKKVMQNIIVINLSKFSPLYIKINLIYIDVRLYAKKYRTKHIESI